MFRWYLRSRLSLNFRSYQNFLKNHSNLMFLTLMFPMSPNFH
jgi:hypothetical protein